jgi:N-methylhydantoinase A
MSGQSDQQVDAGLSLALDVGGTFTDVILTDRRSGKYWIAKSPSVPADPSRGFFNGVDRVLDVASVAPADISTTFHGTTVATNAVLEGKGARTALITTAGFRHVLEIGRADIPRQENLYGWVKPKRPVAARDIFEVPERLLHDGTIHQPLDEAAVQALAETLRARDYAAVAIVLLHSYTNPIHERRVAEILSRALPGIAISPSHEVLPLFREYERSLATVLNATLQPLVGGYIDRLSSGLEQRGISGPFFIMKSNGGIFPPRQAARQPVHLVLSGPAAGARGAALVGRLAGYDDIITIDIGGTSADVALIRGGAPQVSTTGRIGPFPLALPIVDIHSIGAGGGSIARVTPQGALRVGPESAGADPGPAAYGRGGEQATVTDANLVLGRVPPHLLDGQIPLDTARAREAVRRHVAEPLGLTIEAAASGIIEIVDNNMVGALKVMSVERGLTPAAYALCAFGGAGPVHGARLMRLIGMHRCLVPKHPGILCATGLLSTDLKYDFAVTRLQRAPDFDVAGIASSLTTLMQTADNQLAQDGVAAARRRFTRSADLRYAGQGEEIAVPIAAGDISKATLDALLATFHDRHEQLYTFADRTAAVEIVNLRVTAEGLLDHVRFPELDRAPPRSTPPASGERMAILDGQRAAPVSTSRRDALLAGHRIVGPAIVDQLDSTTVVLAGQTATVDAYGTLVIEETTP